VGVDVICDERCLCAGARWTDVPLVERGLTREIYLPLRSLVLVVRSRVERVEPAPIEPWRVWADGFTAGICSAAAARRAAECARAEGLRQVATASRRRVALAAEDSAWAVAHALAGNLALSLRCVATARELLAAAGRED
jgi:hypothetical protein